MRILIATDAAPPQVNGVVTTYASLADELAGRGIVVDFLAPSAFDTVALPGYPEIRLAVAGRRAVQRHLERLAPDFVHVATEGPIGWAVRAACRAAGRPFTTSYHTKLPEYGAAYAGIPASWGYALARRFHNASHGTMVATRSLAADLAARGFMHLLPWTRGVDTERFRPRGTRLFGDCAPVFLYVGRMAREKNLEAFLDLELPGRKVMVGDGPHLGVLRQRYPEALFTGPKSGDDLARHYASADVFVFPSRSDTFGLVLIEAMACGLPVAAFPVTGPVDLVRPGVTGILDADLRAAALKALTLDRGDVRAHAVTFSWARAADQFLANIEAAHRSAAHPAGINPTAHDISARSSACPEL